MILRQKGKSPVALGPECLKKTPDELGVGFSWGAGATPGQLEKLLFAHLFPKLCDTLTPHSGDSTLAMPHAIDAEKKLREIRRQAARVFYEKSYDGASMQDIAQAVGLTKAGLYHHVGSKDRLLYEIMNYGMDLLDETVLQKVKDIPDPREKLRQTIIGHIQLIVQTWDRETTVILHENRSLAGALRKKITLRKKEYIRYLEDLIAQVQGQAGTKPLISARLATFALLGIVNWLYQWYRPEGVIPLDELAQAYADFFLRGLLGVAEP